MIKILATVILFYTSYGREFEKNDDPEYIMTLLSDPKNTWLVVAESLNETKRLKYLEEEDRCIYFTMKTIDASEFWDGYCYYLPERTRSRYMQLMQQNKKAKNKVLCEGIVLTAIESDFNNAILKSECGDSVPLFVIIRPVVKNLSMPENLNILLLVGVKERLEKKYERQMDRTFRSALISTSKLDEYRLYEILRQVKETYFSDLPEMYGIKAPTALSECTLEKSIRRKKKKKFQMRRKSKVIV